MTLWPWSLGTTVLVVGMLLTGTLNTITKKVQNQVRLDRCLVAGLTTAPPGSPRPHARRW